jgi:putative ABC transport system permease protein
MRRTLFVLRWSLRDLRNRWILVATLALVVALATGVGAGLGSMQTWRDRSNDKSFALLHLHDLRVSLAGDSYLPPGALAAAVQHSSVAPMVAAMQERLVVPTQVDASTADRTILVPGKLVGLTLAGPGATIDGRFVQRGRDLRAEDSGKTVAVVEGNFAEHHALTIPTRFRLTGARSLAVVGQVLQPEQFLVTRPGVEFGAEAGYAVLYAPLATVQRLSGHADSVNELILTMRPGTDLPAVARELANGLERALPQVGTTITTRTNEDSYRILYDDAAAEQRLLNVFAWLLLAGAAFASFNLISRVIEAQRRELGIGMALGVPPWRLAIRPLLFAAEVSLLGVAAGIAVGLGFNRILQGELQNLLTLPVWTTPLLVGVYARAATLGFAVPFLAALYPVWRAVRVSPVAAVQVGARTAAGSGLAPALQRMRLPGSTLTKMPLRNVVRTPRRTLMSLLGIAAILTILISLGGALDSFDKTLAISRNETVHGNPNRTTVTLADFLPRGGKTVTTIERSRAVAAAEPTLVLSAASRAGTHTIDMTLELIDPENRVWRPRITAGDFTTGTNGIVLSERAADDLHVRVGDAITLVHPRRSSAAGFRITTTRLRVAALHPNPLRSLAYMDSRRAGLFGLTGTTNALEVQPAARAQPGVVARALFAIPGVASVEPAAAIPDALRGYMDDFLGILRVTQAITLLLALLIAFNTTSIASDERRREHATMFAFGVPTRRVLVATVAESTIIGILGTIAGLGLGFLILGWLMTSVTADVFPDLGTVISLAPGTIATAAVLGIVVVGLAPLLGIRRLRHLDIPSTLRVAE